MGMIKWLINDVLSQDMLLKRVEVFAGYVFIIAINGFIVGALGASLFLKLKGW